VSRDDEQIWAELVESFRSSPDAETRQWPAAENIDPELSDSPAGERDAPNERDVPAESAQPDEPARTDHRDTGHRDSAYDTDEHYVPPPPPPLPRTDLITRAAWASVLGIPVVLTLVVLLGLSVNGWIGVLCAGAFIGGFVVLVARLRGHDPYDPDDGAVV
jgi:hypothetical protein